MLALTRRGGAGWRGVSGWRGGACCRGGGPCGDGHEAQGARPGAGCVSWPVASRPGPGHGRSVVTAEERSEPPSPWSQPPLSSQPCPVAA